MLLCISACFMTSLIIISLFLSFFYVSHTKFLRDGQERGRTWLSWWWQELNFLFRKEGGNGTQMTEVMTLGSPPQFSLLNPGRPPGRRVSSCARKPSTDSYCFFLVGGMGEGGA